jgi:Mn2+/Fe2+ NRAMP family transporter
VTIIVGSALGSLLSIGMLAVAVQLFRPANVSPELPGSIALQTAIPFGKTGLLLGLVGMLIAVAGSAVEVGMTNAYATAQFFGWEWGRHNKPWNAPRFTIGWLATLLLSLLIVLTGVDVMTLVDYAIVLSIIILPLSYFPVMLLADDRSYMGQYANKWLAKGLGWLFFAIVTITAVAAAPLYLLTSGG